MIPAWFMTLPSTNVGEFSYNGKYQINIYGSLINNEWVVNVYVRAFPYFAWGCNKYHTEIKGPFEEVIKYYMMLVFNQVFTYDIGDKRELFSSIREYLE